MRWHTSTDERQLWSLGEVMVPTCPRLPLSGCGLPFDGNLAYQHRSDHLGWLG